MSDLHKELADEASEWAADNGGSPAESSVHAQGESGSSASAATPGAPPAAQPVPSSSERKTDQVDDEEDFEDLDLGAEDIAELGVALLDISLTNFIGEHMALSPAQEKRLVRISTKVANKRLPQLEGAIEPEWALAAALLITYAPKYMAGPRKKPGQSTGSGAEQKPGAPAATTSATVDGREVKAEVLQ